MKTFYCISSLLLLCTLHACTPKSNVTTNSGNWAAESQLNGPARSEAVSFVISNRAYVGSGWDGLNTRFTDFWTYDPKENIWTQVTSMPGVGRSSAIAFAVNDMGYVGTGFDGVNPLGDFYSFDPAGNTWKRIADFPAVRYEAVAFVIGSFGYAGTGFDGSNAMKDFYQYDPVKNLWTDVGFSGNKRYGAATFTYQDKGYLVTGVNSGVMQTDFWVFNPAATGVQWTELRHISNYSTDAYDDNYTTIARWNAAAFVIPPYAYISTGENGSYNSNTWLYDFSTDLWAQKTAFEGPPTSGAVGFTLTPANGGSGFISTGRTKPGQAGSSDYLWQFFPDQTENPNDN